MQNTMMGGGCWRKNIVKTNEWGGEKGEHFIKTGVKALKLHKILRVAFAGEKIKCAIKFKLISKIINLTHVKHRPNYNTVNF